MFSLVSGRSIQQHPGASARSGNEYEQCHVQRADVRSSRVHASDEHYVSPNVSATDACRFSERHSDDGSTTTTDAYRFSERQSHDGFPTAAGPIGHFPSKGFTSRSSHYARCAAFRDQSYA